MSIVLVSVEVLLNRWFCQREVESQTDLQFGRQKHLDDHLLPVPAKVLGKQALPFTKKPHGCRKVIQRSKSISMRHMSRKTYRVCHASNLRTKECTGVGMPGTTEEGEWTQLKAKLLHILNHDRLGFMHGVHTSLL